MIYRPDIDGLRAIAVSVVVLYHAYPSLIKKGYIGVDMFFVISGFLITSIILKEGANFSLMNFYARRFKRILPAFLTVIIATLILGSLFLNAEDLSNLFKHTAASLLFVENFLLFFEVDYFDKAAEYKPLLHIWSLAVEEQFYLIWPLLLIVFIKRDRLLPWMIGFLIIISLIFNIWLLNGYFGDGGRAFAFYFLPSRFWELGLGGFAAWLLLKFPEKFKQIQTHFICEIIILSAVILLICGSIGLFIDRIQAIYGVFPILFILLFGEKTWFNRVILSSKPLVFLGLISYPFYLWHWPLFAIIQLYEAWFLIIIALILSYLTYYFIEKPLRYFKVSALKAVFCSLAILALSAIIFFSFLTFDNKSHEQTDVYTLIKAKYSVNCPYKNATIICAANFKESQDHAVFWGDSHAGHFFGGVAEKETPVSLMMTSACRPLIPSDPQKVMGARRCLQVNLNALQTITSTPSIKTVFMGLYQTNTYNLHGKEYVSKEAFFNAYYADHQKTLNLLFAAGKKVVLLKDVPVLDLDPYKCEKRILFSTPPDCSLTKARAEEKAADYNALLEQLVTEFQQLLIYNPTPLFCSQSQCSTYKDGKILYRDKDHLSLVGSRLVADDLTEFIKNNK